MLKKIDKFVFYVSLCGWVAVLLAFIIAINTGNRDILGYAKYIPYPFGFVIFMRFFTDDYYKLLYYIGFIITNSISNSFFEILMANFMSGLVSIILTFIVIGIISSFLSAFLFEVFKQKSYAKHKMI